MVRVLLHGRELHLHQETEAEESEHEPEAEADLTLPLPVGAEAELRMDDPGFHGSFYEVTITARLPSRRSYRVLYSTLVADDGGPLQETVAAAQVRPRPPPMSAAAGSGMREFTLHQPVEAYHNEGWWPGIVSSVPPPPRRVQECRRPRVYEVAFPTSGDTREFQDTALRPHRVFHLGRWLPAAQLEFINATKLGPLYARGGLLEEKKQALSTLEEYGFEVGALRSRLETLLCRKNSRVGAELRDDAMKALEEKIARDRELGVQIHLLTMAVHVRDIFGCTYMVV